MKGKHASALLVVAALLLPLCARAQSFTWPMAGKSAGEDILCQPQGFVGSEQNHNSLFVGGEKGDAVICPADGIIVNAGLSYYVRLDYVVGSNLDAGSCFDDALPKVNFGPGVDMKYAGGSVTVRIADGRRITLHGMTGDRRFKTGQKIAAGDTLGLLAYSYKGFRTPSGSLWECSIRSKVPELVKTGMPYFEAVSVSPATWSMCSWVMKIP